MILILWLIDLPLIIITACRDWFCHVLASSWHGKFPILFLILSCLHIILSSLVLGGVLCWSGKSWGLILKMTLIIDSKNKRGFKRFLSIFTLQLNKLGVPLSYPGAIFGLCYKPRLRDIMCTVQCTYCWFYVPGVQWNSEALVLSLILNGRLKRQSLYL